MLTSNESALESKYRPCKYKLGANKIRAMRSVIKISQEVLLVVRSCWGKGTFASNSFFFFFK